tara:strand:- start:301 stop:729 length:429 start_codon:yes stop_codon:yes gene_type:complete
MTIKINGVLFGTEEFLATMKGKSDRLSYAVGTAMSEAGLDIKRDAQELVPVEFGILRNSARTKLTRRKNFRSDVTVSFEAAYALAVHENVRMKLKGKKRVSGKGKYWDGKGGQGTSKFLEKAWRNNIDGLRTTIRNTVRATT